MVEEMYKRRQEKDRDCSGLGSSSATLGRSVVGACQEHLRVVCLAIEVVVHSAVFTRQVGKGKGGREKMEG